MCSSRKYPYPPQERLLEIPRREVQKPNFLKESMALKWNFQRGWGGGGFKLKNLPWEGYGYFLEQHNHINTAILMKILDLERSHITAEQDTIQITCCFCKFRAYNALSLCKIKELGLDVRSIDREVCLASRLHSSL